MINSFLSAMSDSVVLRPFAPTTMPIFPIGSVLFPGGTLSLRIFERRYMDMTTNCLKNGAVFGIALIRSGNEVGAAADPETVGTVARIVDWDMQELGILQIRIRGEGRFRLIGKVVSPSGLIVGDTAPIADDVHADCPELAPCVDFLRKVDAQTNSDRFDAPCFDDAAWVSFRITEILPFNNTVKQNLLELTDARLRLEVLHRFLGEQQLIA